MLFIFLYCLILTIYNSALVLSYKNVFLNEVALNDFIYLH